MRWEKWFPYQRDKPTAWLLGFESSAYAISMVQSITPALFNQLGAFPGPHLLLGVTELRCAAPKYYAATNHL